MNFSGQQQPTDPWCYGCFDKLTIVVNRVENHPRNTYFGTNTEESPWGQYVLKNFYNSCSPEKFTPAAPINFVGLIIPSNWDALKDTHETLLSRDVPLCQQVRLQTLIRTSLLARNFTWTKKSRVFKSSGKVTTHFLLV